MQISQRVWTSLAYLLFLCKNKNNSSLNSSTTFLFSLNGYCCAGFSARPNSMRRTSLLEVNADTEVEYWPARPSINPVVRFCALWSALRTTSVLCTRLKKKCDYSKHLPWSSWRGQRKCMHYGPICRSTFPARLREVTSRPGLHEVLDTQYTRYVKCVKDEYTRGLYYLL